MTSPLFYLKCPAVGEPLRRRTGAGRISCTGVRTLLLDSLNFQRLPWLSASSGSSCSLYMQWSEFSIVSPPRKQRKGKEVRMWQPQESSCVKGHGWAAETRKDRAQANDKCGTSTKRLSKSQNFPFLNWSASLWINQGLDSAYARSLSCVHMKCFKCHTNEGWSDWLLALSVTQRWPHPLASDWVGKRPQGVLCWGHQVTVQNPCQPGDPSRCRADGKCASLNDFPAQMEPPAESLFPAPGEWSPKCLALSFPFLVLLPPVGQQVNSN